jgi:hypothetical protein
MKSFSASLVLVPALLGAPAQAAKPGGADTTAPASITDLSVMVAARSLVLRFTATGDDGASGTAAGYDVLYAPLASCSGPPESWPGAVAATRADLQKPIAAGSGDAFTVRPLTAGTDYCVAIRVRDEVPNRSAWATAAARTGGVAGDWPMVAIPPDLSASPTPENLSAEEFVAVADELPAVGEPRVLAVWRIADSPINVTTEHRVGIRFAALSAPTADGAPIPVCSGGATMDCAETILLSNPLLSAHIDALSANHSVAPIPGPNGIVGILVRGTKAPAKRNQAAEDRTVLLERTTSGWTSDRIPCVLGAVSGGPASTIAYVPDGSGGSNPVLTCVSGSTLTLMERAGGPGGTWTSTPLFSRNGGFRIRRVLTTPGGGLGVWASATSPVGEPAIYAVRSPADATGSWGFWDSGSSYAPDDVGIYALALDANGELIVASTPYSSGTQTVAIRQADFVPLAGPPAAGIASSVPQSAWHELVSAAPGVTFSTVAGLSADACDGAIRVATRNIYPLPTSASIPELRFASVIAAPGVSSAVDHVPSGTPAVVGLPNGDVAVLTSWTTYGGNPVRYLSRPSQDVYLVRALVGSCPPAPQ